MKAKHRAWCYFKPTYTNIAKHSFKVISDITRQAIRFYNRNTELKVLHSKALKSFYKYVNTRIHLRPSSSNPDQIINDLVEVLVHK